ncbi:MAG: diacylglycerol kinase catalytic region [Solirubrobacterales bacterium]|nr:diacylglycerol kinase catalytic region [Solirubrobacterales bacterium]
MMRMLLIANPASGSGVDADTMSSRLKKLGADPVLVPAKDLGGRHPVGPGADGAQRVVAAGGDGTLGPAAELAARLDVPLAVVPTGTANDLARALGLPLDDLDAALTLAVTGTRTRLVDLAHAGPTPFLNAASAGLSVHATQRAEPLKRPLGPLAYAAGALHAGLRATPVGVRVGVDDEPVYVGAAWQVIVAGTGAFGGGSEFDEAEPGALDVAVLTGGPRLGLVRRAYGMRKGGLAAQPGVLHARGSTVTVAGPRRFNVDGDVREVPEGRFTLGPRVGIVVA